MSFRCSPHDLRAILRRPPGLRKAQTPLDALQHLPRALITHDMRLLITTMQLLSRTTLVDTHHRYTNGPGSLANTETEVCVVGVDVLLQLCQMYDLVDALEEGREEGVGFQFCE